MSLGLPGTPMGDAWRLADRLREYRGDVHTAAWTSAGFDATEIGLLSRALLGPARPLVRRGRGPGATPTSTPPRSASRRGACWPTAGSPTRGVAEREAVEVTTDAQCRPIVDALGDDLDELLGILLPWGASIRDAAGYPASGPHDLADAVAARP